MQDKWMQIMKNAKRNMMLYTIHHKQVNKKEKEIGIRRYTHYYKCALAQEESNECLNKLLQRQKSTSYPN